MKMSCDCKKNLEAKLLERFKEQQSAATNHEATLQGYGLVVDDNKMVSRGYMPVQLSASYPVKKGGSRVKKSEMSMFFSFCPFCGVKV